MTVNVAAVTAPTCTGRYSGRVEPLAENSHPSFVLMTTQGKVVLTYSQRGFSSVLCDSRHCYSLNNNSNTAVKHSLTDCTQ